MNVYPHSSPLILNDTIFNLYGGQFGSFTQLQRNAAYLIAEKQTTNYIGTFLLPTVVTGTFGYGGMVVTDYGYVHQILSVNTLSVGGNCAISSNSACAWIWDDTFGYVNSACLSSYSNCGFGGVPSQVQLAYQAGLPTGTANQPDFLLAMTMAAQITLNEMTFPSQNEGVGDVGITEFTSLDYKEARVKFKKTVFGSSARAAKIASLLDGAVRKARPALMLR